MYNRTRDTGFGTEVKRRIMLGTYALSAGYYDEYYGTAQRARRMITEDFRSVFDDGVDALFTPTSPTPAFKVGEHPAVIDGEAVPDKLWGFTPFTYPFNMCGNPAATAPAGFSSDGLPIGLHIVGRWGDEETVMAASKAFEDGRPWADKRPAGFE